MDSEIDFSSNSDYDEFANEILFVGNILQPFQFEPIFIQAVIQAEKDLAGPSVVVFDWLLHHRTWCTTSSLGGQKLKDGCSY